MGLYGHALVAIGRGLAFTRLAEFIGCLGRVSAVIGVEIGPVTTVVVGCRKLAGGDDADGVIECGGTDRTRRVRSLRRYQVNFG